MTAAREPLSPFRKALSDLVKAEHDEGMCDAARMADVVDALAAMLGLSVALMVRGNPAGIDELAIGVEQRIHKLAVRVAPTARTLPPYEETVR